MAHIYTKEQMKTSNYLAHETKNQQIKIKMKKWRRIKVQGQTRHFIESDKSNEDSPQRYENL